MWIVRETCWLAIALSLASVLVASEGSSQGRRCAVATVPGTLPDLATVVDADTLRRAIAAELAGSSTAGAMLFSIRFAEDGQTEWVERVGNETADLPLQSRVQGLIAAQLKTQASAEEPWSLRLQVTSGDSVQLRLNHSEVCHAVPIADAGPATGSRTGNMSVQDIAELQRARSFRIGVDISAIGEVLRVELLQSSGSRIQDDRALQTAREARYRPALVDGIPVAAWYEIRSRSTVRVRTRSIRRSPG